MPKKIEHISIKEDIEFILRRINIYLVPHKDNHEALKKFLENNFNQLMQQKDKLDLKEFATKLIDSLGELSKQLANSSLQLKPAATSFPFFGSRDLRDTVKAYIEFLKFTMAMEKDFTDETTPSPKKPGK